MVDYNVIATSSKGNASVINKTILIDCGVPFKSLKSVCKDLQLVLLTHRHTDHFNVATIKRLAQERPTLRWGVPAWLVWDIDSLRCGIKDENIDVYAPEEIYSYGTFSIETCSLPHDIPNMGYKIYLPDGKKIIYATDTNDISHVCAPSFDLYLIEANHTEEDMQERIRTKEEAGEYIYEYAAMQNHLSKEKCDAWLLENMGDNSEYVYMHRHTD